MSIRKTMSITVSLMILAPFLLFSLVVSGLYNERMKTLIEDSLQSVANAQIYEMTSFCEQQMKELSSLSETAVFHAALKGELDGETLRYVSNMLQSRVEQTDYLTTSTLINTDHQVVACSEREYEVQVQQSFDVLSARAGEEGFYISNVLSIRNEAGERKAVIAVERVEEAGETIGYILAEIDPNFYTDIRKSSMLWEDSTFYLLDGNGQIISAGTAEDDRKDFITTAEERADYNAKYNAIDFEACPKGSFTYQIGGRNYITYYSDVNYTQWMIQLTLSPDDYMAQGSVNMVLLGFVIGLCLLLAVWIAWFTSRRIMGPINRISAVLDEVREKQDYSLRIRGGKNDELGVLGNEVNRLIDFIETENLDIARKQRILQAKADQDGLTKVMNRERIEAYLTEALSRGRREGRTLAVLFADVDDFKAFNSQYGHSVGDQVLQFFAAVFARQTEGVVGRLGGDEFLVILEEPEEVEGLEDCLVRVKTRLEHDFILRGGGPVPVFCCIGALKVDCRAAETPGARELIDRADALMYEVKNHGKHGYRIGTLDGADGPEERN